MELPHDASTREQTRLRDLIAEGLQCLDEGGEAALEAFLARHGGDAPFIRERLRALDQAGLLAKKTADAFPERLGDFRLLRRLGSGGMGVVYAAVQESLQREVALKMIRPEHLYFPGARERFRREVESVARLQHPGIVPIHVVGEANGVPFFAMELVRGKTLAEIVATVQANDAATLAADAVREAVGSGSSGDRIDLGRSWVEAALRLCLQVADALQHAHERGVLHRDVKPSNVMVTPSGRALLLDFGLAVVEGGPQLTRTGHNVGSLLYMAPEQVLGQSADVGPWTDVYALGVVLYELLTLRSPFVSETTEVTRSRILAGEAAPPRTLNPAIPWDVETICTKAMQRAHQKRYRSAGELATDLRSFLELRPIAADRPGVADRVRSWVHRHPIRTLLGVAGAVLLVAGPAAFAVQEALASARIRAALAQAEADFQRALSAVDELLREVGSRQLRDVPRMDEVRANLLRSAHRHYDDFLAARPNDVDLRLKACLLAQQFAEAMQRLGRFDEAEVHARRAVELAAACARDRPGDRAVQRQVAVAHYALGYLFMAMARTGPAQAEFAEVVRCYRELLVLQPGNVDHTAEMADALRNQAALLVRVGALDRAQQTFEEARDLLAQLAAAQPERAEFRERLGHAWQAIGSVHRVSGRRPMARSALERSIELYQALPPARRSDRTVKIAEAISLRHLGDVLVEVATWEEAESALRRSIALRQALVDDHPLAPEHRRDLALARIDLGDKLLDRGRLDEAAIELRGAIALLDPLLEQAPAVAEYRSHQGVAWMQLGRVLARQREREQAIEAFAVARRLHEEAIERDARDPSYRMRLATVAASLGETLLDLGDHRAAIRSLEESIRVLLAAVGDVQAPAGVDRVLAQRRLWLARAHYAAGAVESAVAAAREMRSAPADYKLDAAGLLARIAGSAQGQSADEAAQAAVAFLRELRQTDPAKVDRDAEAFAPLRGREDYEALFR